MDRDVSTPAGWYDDGSGTTRWWDGQRWSDGPPDESTALRPQSDPSGGYPSNPSNPSNPNHPGGGQYGGQYGGGQYGGGQGAYGQSYGSGAPGEGHGAGYGGAYGGGYGDNQQPPRTSKKGLKIAAVVALVLLLIAGAGVAAWQFWPIGSDNEEAGEEIESEPIADAVDALYAVTSCEEESELVTGERAEVLDAAGDAIDGYCDALPDYTYETEIVSTDSSSDTGTATVEVSGTYGGSLEGFSSYERIIAFEFEKVDEAWLVARREVGGANPEEGANAYYSASTCAEQLETVTDDRAEEIQTALDESGEYCENLPETVYLPDLEVADESDDEATLEGAVEVLGPLSDYDDEVTTSVVVNDVGGWVVGANVSEATLVAEAGISWYTYPTCEEVIEHSVDPIRQQFVDSASSPESSCRHLDDWVYDPAFNVKPEVDGDEGYVEYDIRGLYVGDEGRPDIGARVYVDLVKVDDEWFVSNVSDTPLSQVS